MRLNKEERLVAAKRLRTWTYGDTWHVLKDIGLEFEVVFAQPADG